MSKTRVNINPKILSFAREMSGYEIPEIAKKVQVKEDGWLGWEKGEKKPTSKQLLKIADKLDRTPGFFYLNEPPKEEPALSEFRTINNIPLDDPSPNLIKAIREAKRNRDTLLELYELENREPQEIPKPNIRQNNVEEIGAYIRDWLGLSFDKQNSWVSSSNALTEWKGLFEDKDIYIVQFPYVDLEQARGFALSEEKIPIIGINSKDSYNGRIFTLIHEFCHILVRDSVLVNNNPSDYFESNTLATERYCNALTAEITVPKNYIRELFDRDDNLLRQVKSLSNKFRVSNYVISIRLKNLSLISQTEFRDLLPDVAYNGSDDAGGSQGNAYYNQIVRKGKLLVKSAFEAYFNENISLPELAKITSWKAPNLNELAIKTFKWPDEGQYI